MDLSNSSAIVTGGGSGLGEACARRLAALGAKCVVVDLNEEKAASLLKQMCLIQSKFKWR
jgi:NAD(P)-dependent dehydrogenase (short-subunit alcohol dehydrogenase family)